MLPQTELQNRHKIAALGTPVVVPVNIIAAAALAVSGEGLVPS
jgi:hypothetical protein